jgi:hypothetical protein
MTVLNTLLPKTLSICARMSRASAVRLSCIVMTTPRMRRSGFARMRTFSMVSSRSSVPSRAKYDDWMGMSRCVDATRALTVSSPSVGGQSITICGKRGRSAAILSFRRKCASSSPTSRDSSLASAMRDGATNRFSCAVGRTMSSIDTEGSVMASYMPRSTVDMSRYDIVLLAWGSRSMRRVGLPRIESAAARFTAVVVLPTPPF